MLVLIDHKIIHDEKIIHYKINSNNASVGDIGILIDNNSLKSLRDIIKCNNRILITHFHVNPKMTIIKHYSPCEGSEHA